MFETEFELEYARLTKITNIKPSTVLSIYDLMPCAYYTVYSRLPLFCIFIDESLINSTTMIYQYLCVAFDTDRFNQIEKNEITLEEAFTIGSPQCFLINCYSNFAVKSYKEVYYSELPEEYKFKPGIKLFKDKA
jgi:hypothetical protein